VRDEIHLIALVTEMKVIPSWGVDGLGCDRAVERARAIADFGEHDLAAQHCAIEKRYRVPVEVRLIERLELIGDQAAVAAQRIDEPFGIPLAHDRRDSQVQRRHECRKDHQHHADQADAQAVD